MRIGRVVAPLVAVVVASVALTACGGDAEPKPDASPSCPTALPSPTMKIAPSTIYVNIVNASDTSGLAARTSTQLTWRGYKVLGTSNPSVDDPESSGPAEIRYGDSGRQIALTLATQIKSAKLVKVERADPTVDLVLGNGFGLVPVSPPPAKEIKVNVYNTTFRSGLSGEVADQLRGRGFQIGENNNDPRKQFLPNDVALIRHGEQGEPAARRVQLQFKGSRLVQDGRAGTGIDIALGNKYSALVPQAQATPAPVPTSTPPPGC